VRSAVALPKRGLLEETCRLFGYLPASVGSQPAQVAQYVAADGSGTVVAQHVRLPGKEFFWRGDVKAAEPLWGMHLWRDGGKMVVITEGEIDAMSVSQAQGNKWPVVSIKSGASGAKKDVAAALPWLERFETVVLLFDSDEPGQRAAQEAALVLPPGKAKIAKLPLKDANEMLVAGRAKDLIDAIWGAKEFRPDGIITLADVRDAAIEPPETGLPWWDERLTAVTYGRRLGEVYTFGAGTGCGKTDWLLQQIAYDLDVLGLRVGAFLFEQAPRETAIRLAGKVAGKRFHVPDAGWTREELVEAVDAVASKPLYLYNHWGQSSWDVVKPYIRYLVRSCGVTSIYIDHLTAFASGSQDERGMLEALMGEVAGLAQELRVMVHLVSHLSTPEGRPHEEGGRVMIRHFKGSRAIGYWSHYMFGIERNQQAEDEEERRRALFRVLKDRYTGQAAGVVLPLTYSQETGRLVPAEMAFDAEALGEDSAL
jgi:twinkle protein